MPHSFVYRALLVALLASGGMALEYACGWVTPGGDDAGPNLVAKLQGATL
jgi:hypothetical protein